MAQNDRHHQPQHAPQLHRREPGNGSDSDDFETDFPAQQAAQRAASDASPAPQPSPISAASPVQQLSPAVNLMTQVAPEAHEISTQSPALAEHGCQAHSAAMFEGSEVDADTHGATALLGADAVCQPCTAEDCFAEVQVADVAASDAEAGAAAEATTHRAQFATPAAGSPEASVPATQPLPQSVDPFTACAAVECSADASDKMQLPAETSDLGQSVAWVASEDAIPHSPPALPAAPHTEVQARQDEQVDWGPVVASAENSPSELQGQQLRSSAEPRATAAERKSPSHQAPGAADATDVADAHAVPLHESLPDNSAADLFTAQTSDASNPVMGARDPSAQPNFKAHSSPAMIAAADHGPSDDDIQPEQGAQVSAAAEGKAAPRCVQAVSGAEQAAGKGSRKPRLREADRLKPFYYDKLLGQEPVGVTWPLKAALAGQDVALLDSSDRSGASHRCVVEMHVLAF